MAPWDHPLGVGLSRSRRRLALASVALRMRVDLPILEVEVPVPGSLRNRGALVPMARRAWRRRGALPLPAAEGPHPPSRATIPSTRAADHPTAAASQRVRGPTQAWEDLVVAAILPRWERVSGIVYCQLPLNKQAVGEQGKPQLVLANSCLHQ